MKMIHFVLFSFFSINTIMPSDTCSGEPERFFSKPKTETEFKNTQKLVYDKIVWVSKNPGSRCAKDQMADVYFWIKGVPYLGVPFNSEYMPKFAENNEKYEYFNVFFSLFIYSQLLYMKDFENNGPDDPKMIKFSLDFTLDSYSNFIDKTDSDGYAPLNEMLTLRREGGLEKYIAEKHEQYEAEKRMKKRK